MTPRTCQLFSGGMGAICALSFSKITDAFLERWVLFIWNSENDLILISLMSEIFLWWQHHFSLRLKVCLWTFHFPTEIFFQQLLFELKGSVRSCNLLKHCPDLVALQTPVLTQRDVFTLVADKPARLASVAICQIRCKKTNSEAVTLSMQRLSLVVQTDVSWADSSPFWYLSIWDTAA